MNGEWFLVEAKGLVQCKLGKSIRPPDRLTEAMSESSTWHPERFRILFFKSVPSMKDAEDTLRTFFGKTHITPAYLKGGIEWHLVQPERARHLFEAIEGGSVLESTEDIAWPRPVPREETTTECTTVETSIKKFLSQWDGTEMSSADLFEKYRSWCVENNEVPLENQIQLGRRLLTCIKDGLLASQRKGGNTNYYWKPPSATITFADWKDVVGRNNLTTAEEYTEWQSTHPDLPSLEVLLTGRFEGITNYNSLTEGLFGRSGRQR